MLLRIEECFCYGTESFQLTITNAPDFRATREEIQVSPYFGILRHIFISLTISNQKMALNIRQFAITIKHLAIRNEQLTIPNQQMAMSNWHLAYGNEGLAFGSWHLAIGI